MRSVQKACISGVETIYCPRRNVRTSPCMWLGIKILLKMAFNVYYLSLLLVLVIILLTYFKLLIAYYKY